MGVGLINETVDLYEKKKVERINREVKISRKIRHCTLTLYESLFDL